MTVEIYTIPNCSYCKLAKELLEKYKVRYREYNVEEDREARARVIELSHQKGVPVIDVDGEIFVGFNRTELEKALGL